MPAGRRRRALAVASLLLLAAALRVAVAVYWSPLSGDDATVALMAKDALHGRAFPVFFYRQTYMGSVSAFLMVPGLFLFGPSVLLVHLTAVAWSLLFPLGLYGLGRRIFDEATGRAALLVAAVPPFLLTYWSTIVEPHFLPNVFGALLGLLMLQALRAPPGPRYERVLAVFGLTAGIATWESYKVVTLLGPAVLVLLIHDPRLPRRRAALLASGLFAVGVAPVWLYYATFGNRASGTLGSAGRMLVMGLNHEPGYLLDFLRTVPATMLGTYYWAVDTAARRGALALNLAAYAVATVAALVEAVGRSRRAGEPAERRGGLGWLVLVLVAPFAALYLSEFSEPLDRESARYTLPAYVPLLLFAGALLARLWRRSRAAASLLAAFLLVFDLWTSFAYLWPFHPEKGAAVASIAAGQERLQREIFEQGVEALYVDGGYRSLAFQFLLDGVQVSEMTTETDAPSAVVADTAERIAILARETRPMRPQLAQLGFSYRATTPVSGLVLYGDLRLNARAYRFVPRQDWREAGQTGPHPAVADGDLSTLWPPDPLERPPGATPPRQLVVDMGRARPVGRVVWWPTSESSRTVSVSVEGSLDGQAWEPVGVAPGLPGRPAFVVDGRPFFRPRNGWLEIRLLPARPTRYLRFAAAEADSNDNWGVAELMVYEDVGDRPEGDRAPATRAVLEAMREAGARRLVADVAVSARVLRQSGGDVRTLPANGVLDANGWAPPAWLAVGLSLRATDGLLVGPEDVEDVEQRLTADGVGFRETAVGDHRLLSGLHPLPAPFACKPPRRVRVTRTALTADGKGARYRLDAELSRVERIAGLRVDHAQVSARHVPLPILEGSPDGRSWTPVEVRRLTTWAWAGRTLLRSIAGREELAMATTPLRYLRLDVQMPYVGDDALKHFCVRAEGQTS